MACSGMACAVHYMAAALVRSCCGKEGAGERNIGQTRMVGENHQKPRKTTKPRRPASEGMQAFVFLCSKTKSWTQLNTVDTLPIMNQPNILKRVIQIMATLNVLACAGLFVWFRTIPPQSAFNEKMTSTTLAIAKMPDPHAGGLAFIYQWNIEARKAWEARAIQFRHMTLATGMIVAINTLVFVLALLGQSRNQSKTDSKTQSHTPSKMPARPLKQMDPPTA